MNGLNPGVISKKVEYDRPGERTVVLKRTVVVGRDLRFDNLCSSCDNYEDLCSSHGSVTCMYKENFGC